MFDQHQTVTKKNPGFQTVNYYHNNAIKTEYEGML